MKPPAPIAPIELTPSVQDGSVFCPTRMAYVGVERCLQCRFFVRLRYDTEDRLAELVCSPSRAALLSGMSI